MFPVHTQDLWVGWAGGREPFKLLMSVTHTRKIPKQKTVNKQCFAFLCFCFHTKLQQKGFSLAFLSLLLNGHRALWEPEKLEGSSNLMNVYMFMLMGRKWLGGSMCPCADAHTETCERDEIPVFIFFTGTRAAVGFIGCLRVNKRACSFTKCMWPIFTNKKRLARG